MEEFKVVDRGSIIFYLVSIAIITFSSYHYTGALWQSLVMGIICGALFWVSYLTFRCIRQSFRE